MNGKFEESIFQTVTKLRLNHRNAIKCNRQPSRLVRWNFLAERSRIRSARQRGPR